MARLEQRILCEGRAGLLDGLDAKRRLQQQLYAIASQQRSELALFAGVGAGQHDLHRLEPWAQGLSASRCSPHSSSHPVAARFSNASSSWRWNGWPSAVPCTSMNAPAAFITTFMSVSASESSP